jgi:hypothetical protein
MALFHYWQRSVAQESLSITDPNAPVWLGSNAASQDLSDTHIRTLLWPSYRVLVNNFLPPTDDTFVTQALVQFVIWVTTNHDESPMDPNSNDRRIVGGATLIPHFIQSPLNAQRYQVVWDMGGEHVDVFAQRKTQFTPTDFPELNVGYQVLDPSGVLFNVSSKSLKVAAYATIHTLWGSTVFP